MPKLANGHIRKPEVAKAARTLRYNWDDVIFFLEVARTRNLVRAGQKLKVDHTTVSRRVRELERSLNTTLFKRSKAGFALTEAGLRLLQFAEGMENNANAIVETVVGSEKADAAGAVRIASMEGIGSMYLTACMAAFSKAYPSIQVELITDTRLLDMTRREADGEVLRTCVLGRTALFEEAPWPVLRTSTNRVVGSVRGWPSRSR